MPFNYSFPRFGTWQHDLPQKVLFMFWPFCKAALKMKGFSALYPWNWDIKSIFVSVSYLAVSPDCIITVLNHPVMAGADPCRDLFNQRRIY